MIDLALNTAGDLDLQGYDLQTLTGADLVAQRLRIKLRTFLGEWFLDTDWGVPYYDEILVKNPDSARLEAIFKAQILETPGVIELQRFDMSLNRSSRELQISFQAVSSDGPITITEIL